MHKTAPDGDCNQVVQLHVKVINRCSVPFSPFSFFKTKELTQGRMSRSTIANVGLFSISSIQRKMWLGISYSILRQVYNEPSLMKHLDNIFIWKERDVNLAVLYVDGLNITKAYFFYWQMSFYLQMVLFIPFKVYKWKIKLFCRKVIIIALIYFLDTQKPARFLTLWKKFKYIFLIFWFPLFK